MFTLLAAAIVGPSGKVLAFEPCSKTFSRLIQNVRCNKLSQVDCHRCAISNATGTARLSVSCGEFGAWNSLAGALNRGEYSFEDVATVTWDEFAERHAAPTRIALFKIDVEGWELAVIEGAHRLLSRTDAPVLQVEFTRSNALAAGTTCERLFERIQQHGYALYRFHPETAQLHEVERAPDDAYCNLYALKNFEDVASRLARTG